MDIFKDRRPSYVCILHPFSRLLFDNILCQLNGEMFGVTYRSRERLSRFGCKIGKFLIVSRPGLSERQSS